jgi:F-type H+-transporting ATPase subunit b
MDILLENLHNLGFDTSVAIANFVNFLIIFFILKVLFFERIKKTLEDRRARIEQGLEDARIAKEAKALVFEERNKLLADTQEEALHILEATKAKSDTLAKSIVDEAEQKSNQLIQKAEAEFKSLTHAYEESLSKELPTIVSKLAAQVLGSTVTEKINEDIVRKALRK